MRVCIIYRTALDNILACVYKLYSKGTRSHSFRVDELKQASKTKEREQVKNKKKLALTSPTPRLRRWKSTQAAALHRPCLSISIACQAEGATRQKFRSSSRSSTGCRATGAAFAWGGGKEGDGSRRPREGRWERREREGRYRLWFVLGDLFLSGR